VEAGLVLVLLLTPLGLIYARSVARRFRLRLLGGAAKPLAGAAWRVVPALLLALALAVYAAGPDAALLPPALANNGGALLVLDALRTVGGLAAVLFFLSIPFVIGRLVGTALALAGIPRAPEPEPERERFVRFRQPPRSEPMPAKTPLVIAIDGPAAAGKGTLAKRLAEAYALPYLDTGLLYRAVGRLAAEAGIDLDDADAVGAIARGLRTDHLDDPSLRGREAGERASRVAAHYPVRTALLAFQQGFARAPEGAVLDGRDIGTVICPDADVKIFVTASPEVRARRRSDELIAKGRDAPYERILEETRERDARDAGRAIAPLRPAADAHLLDTSDLDIEAAFRAACRIVDDALAARAKRD
jgi:cytidylate kinase